MICLICGKEFIKNGHNQKCCSQECSKINNKNYFKTLEYKEYGKQYNKIHAKERKEDRYKLRLKVIEHYSNGTMQCNCCGEKETKFLTIDHIDCGKLLHGKKKRLNKFTGRQLYLHIINNNFPEGYQVLCFNCNCAKGMYGKCPHEIEK